MTTPDPQALYAACQRLERATGRKIVPPWIEWTGCRFHIRDDSYAWCCNDEAAARILRDALWEAVQPTAADAGFICEWGFSGVAIWQPPRNWLCANADLPAAAHAISGWCEANRPTPPAP